MPQQIIGLSQNLGFLGTVSRNGKENIEGNRAVKSGDTLTPNFGDPLVLNNDVPFGSYSSVASFIAGGGTFTAALFAGLAVRQVKTVLTYLAQNTVGMYVAGQHIPVLSEGCMSVLCRVGAPSANGNVYIRTAVNAAIPAGVVGGLEATADGTNTVLLTGVKWHSGLIDVNFVAEVNILNRLIG